MSAIGLQCPAFVVAAGSVRGKEHARVGRNNQDAAAARAFGPFAVAVVADGCSAGAASEVGARVAAACVAACAPRLARWPGPARAWVDDVTTALLATLGVLARAMAPDEAERAAAVREHLLFTLLAAVVTPERAVVFGCGDGAFAIDGRRVVLDAGPENAPDYLAYALLAPGACDVPPRRSISTIHHDAPSAGLRSIALATDGARPLFEAPARELARFEEEPCFASNPSLLQKRLNVLAQGEPSFDDDATLALVRRVEAP